MHACFRKRLENGHVILLNSKDSAYYEQTRQQALSALQAYPGGLQIGGGITAENAREYLDAGASHVIVTSYVFRNGDISFENLNRMMDAVGKKRLVLDLSCRKKDGKFPLSCIQLSVLLMVIVAICQPITHHCLKLSVKTFCEIPSILRCSSLNLHGRSFSYANQQFPFSFPIRE